MNRAINIYSGPKLLANPPDRILIVLAAGDASETCLVSKHLPHCTIETIRERAEMVTPVLKQILDYLPPERWGLNE